MRQGIRKILITGGAGFIGSAFVRLLLTRDCPRSTTKGLSPQEAISEDTKGTVPKLIVVDKLTYAGDLERLKEVEGKYKFYKADICAKKRIEAIFKEEKPDIIVNFSAETHVDRSILDPTAFLKTNVIGTQVLLDLSRKYKVKKFCHISSDEVYGDIKKGSFKETSPLQPNSPYAASKAAADLLIRSYIKTYGFPALIIRPCNNYGPWQYPEKLIPLAILKILNNEKVPIYGAGKNVREWLYVEDCAGGILEIIERGRKGEIYNLGSGAQKYNLDVVNNVFDILNKSKNLISFVKDRPGHDFRYSLNSSRIHRLGWRPKYDFKQGLLLTVKWYLGNSAWWQKIKERKDYRLYYSKWYEEKIKN